MAVAGGGATERAGTEETNAKLAEAAARLDQIERDQGARLDALAQRVDEGAGLAEVKARLDALEKKIPSASDGALAARLDRIEKKLAAPPTSPSPADAADLKTRLDKLEKKVAAYSPPLAASTRTAPGTPGAPPPPNPRAPRTVLQGYSVEAVQDGLALVASRFGEVQVAPGDEIPGAGRVLRIERQGGGWTVVTSAGVIAGGAPQ